jgi:hypothetical protein
LVFENNLDVSLIYLVFFGKIKNSIIKLTINESTDGFINIDYLIEI